MTVPLSDSFAALAPMSAAIELIARSPVAALYIGPDQILPLTSVLGAITGLALMFWNRLLGVVRRSLDLFKRRSDSTEPDRTAP
jgi:hypothetical protein